MARKVLLSFLGTGPLESKETRTYKDIHPEQQHGERHEDDGGEEDFHQSGNSEEMGW